MQSRFLKKVAILSVFFLLLSGLYFSFERKRYNLVSHEDLRQIREKLQVLSEEERGDLSYFFNFANMFCQYPFTLVDSKPMSICNYLQESDDLPPVFHADYARPEHRAFADRLEKGFRIWEKYQSLFPRKKYRLIHYHASNSKGMREIALIHSGLCREMMEMHFEDFQKSLSDCENGKDAFAILTNPNHEKFYQIVENDRLLGMILGFGRNNAILWEKKDHQKLKCFSNERPIWPRRWCLPGFVCDHSTEETKQLKKSYREARKHIHWSYFLRDELEVTLALLERD